MYRLLGILPPVGRWAVFQSGAGGLAVVESTDLAQRGARDYGRY
jgi:hypothetical protein